MRPSKLHQSLFSLVTIAQTTALVLLLLSAVAVLAERFILRIVPSEFSAAIQTLIDWLATHSERISLGLGAAVTIAAAARKCLGEPWLWDCVSDILREFQNKIFSELNDGESADDHRVTLYRYRSLCWPKCRGRPWYWPFRRGEWPWSGWLVPMVRAGPPKARATTVFLAENGSSFEGVCGAAYFQQSLTIAVPSADQHSLPELHENSPQSEFDDYARRTFLSADAVRSRIKERRPCARYFLAHTIETEPGKRWGVIMIDTKSEGMPQPRVAPYRFTQLKEILCHLLEKT